MNIGSVLIISNGFYHLKAYFKVLRFLFVLVPISISWKVIAVRVDTINWKGAADFQKDLLCDSLWCLSCLKQHHIFGRAKCYLVDYLFSVAFGRWTFQVPGWDIRKEWRDLFLKTQNIRKKELISITSIWWLHNLELYSAENLLAVYPTK